VELHGAFYTASILVVATSGRSDPDLHGPRKCLASDSSAGPGTRHHRTEKGVT
jgi:hypothetical protein